MAQNVRIRIEPKEIPPEAAARRMGVPYSIFQQQLPKLIARGFPAADPDLGTYDIDAIDAWRRSRHSHLYGEAAIMGPRDASTVVQDRITAMRKGSAA